MANDRGLKLTTLPFASVACRGKTLLWSDVDGSLAVIISEQLSSQLCETQSDVTLVP